MIQHNDRPQYAPGDKVRITIDATVVRSDEYSLTGRYVSETGIPEVEVALDSNATTVLPGTGQPMGFEDYATTFEQISRIYEQYDNGEIGGRQAMEAIHEQVGDRPERLGGAS